MASPITVSRGSEAAEVRRKRQHRNAESAFRKLPASKRKAMREEGLAPIEEHRLQLGRDDDCKRTVSLGKHAAYLVDDAPLPGDESPLIIQDAERYQTGGYDAWQAIDAVVTAMCAGFQRGPALGRALLAVLHGGHQDKNLKLIAVPKIAKAHGCRPEDLRRMLVGLRPLIEWPSDPLSK